MAQKLQLESVRVIYKNFSGEKKQYNNEGDRNFSIVLDDIAFAESLIDEGWNFKPLKNSDDGEIEAYHLKVKISYQVVPPRINTIKQSGRLALDEKTVSMLDYLPIKHVDIVINPYHWTVNGDSGVTAYVGNMYVIVDEDELDLKYSDLPEINAVVPRDS